MSYLLNTFLLVFIVSISSVSIAQTNNQKATFDEVQKETNDLMQALESYSKSKSESAIEDVDAALERTDQRIEALESRIDDEWDETTESARKEARENLKQLRQKRLEVAKWYGGLLNSTAESWDYMKKGFSKAYNDLQRYWEKSQKEFSSKNK